jgi:tetratricopeptide (TPR) repeat protein
MRRKIRPVLQHSDVLEASSHAATAQPSNAGLTAELFAEAVRYHQLGQLPQAEALYRANIAINTSPADACYNLGLLLQHERRFPDAIAAYRHAIVVRPDYVEAYSNLGTVLQELKRLDEAVEIYRQAITLRPSFAMAYSNLGTALKEQGKFAEAIAAYQQSVSLNPESELGFANLGAALLEMQDYAGAIAACSRAIDINPATTMAHCNLAATCKAQNLLPDAAAAYRAAIASSPDYPEAHFGLSQILFLQGNLRAAWEEYEWRWKLREYGWLQNLHGKFTQPRWTGERLDGRTILVYAEQGLGDTIQFVRFIPEVVKAGGRVVLAVHPPLLKLLSDIEDVTLVALDQRPLPPFDVHSPLLSLPRVFGTTLDTIPRRNPYLHADAELAARWRARIGTRRLKVGIIWAGNPTQTGDRLRSPHLAAMAPLFDVPGVDFICLQVGAARAEIEQRPLPANVLDLGGEISDFADTAAIMSGLDLVITSCTAPLHLAGALGIPTWAVLPFAPHFFWLLDRTDSPWYPTLRLYRQDNPTSGWSRVVSRVADDLARLAVNADIAAKVPA